MFCGAATEPFVPALDRDPFGFPSEVDLFLPSHPQSDQALQLAPGDGAQVMRLAPSHHLSKNLTPSATLIFPRDSGERTRFFHVKHDRVTEILQLDTPYLSSCIYRRSVRYESLQREEPVEKFDTFFRNFPELSTCFSQRIFPHKKKSTANHGKRRGISGTVITRFSSTSEYGTYFACLST